MGHKRYLKDSILRFPDTVYYNPVYVAKLLGSPTIPISFSKLEYNNKTFEVNPTVSIGYGYTWVTGDFIFNENEKITIDPKLFFGVVATLGM